MSFTAKYRGTCAECGLDVLPGQEITYVEPFGAGGEVRHVDCPEDRALRPREICPRCFMELPRTGVCGTPGCGPE